MLTNDFSKGNELRSSRTRDFDHKALVNLYGL